MRRFLGKKASFRVLITPSLNSPKESFLLTCFFFFQVWRIRNVVVHPDHEDLVASQNNHLDDVIKSQLSDVV